MEKENENSLEYPEMEVSGKAHAENPVFDDEPVEYNSGTEADPMEEIASEFDADVAVQAETEVQGDSDTEVIDEPQQPESMSEAMMGDSTEVSDTPAPDKPVIGGELDESKIKEDPTLSESDKPTFNPDTVQSPLVSEEVEGGVIKNRSTGPTMSQHKESEGELLKPKPDMEKDSLVNKFEMTGFEVEYESGKEIHTAIIRDYFDDLESAHASVNSNKYLMPMPKGGFKVSTISSGAPTISYNERQVYNYKNGKWDRT